MSRQFLIILVGTFYSKIRLSFSYKSCIFPNSANENSKIKFTPHNDTKHKKWFPQKINDPVHPPKKPHRNS